MKNVELLGTLWLVTMCLNKFFAPIYQPFILLKGVFSYFLMYGNFFFAGILFYNLRTKGNSWYRHFGLVLCLLVTYLCSCREETVVFFVFLVVFYLFIYGHLTWLSQKPLIYLGAISYSLYLTHSKIGFVILQYLDILQVNPYVKFILPLACAFIIATLMTYCIERQAMKYIRRTYKDWEKRRALKKVLD